MKEWLGRWFSNGGCPPASPDGEIKVAESEKIEAGAREAKRQWIEVFGTAISDHLYDLGDITVLNRQSSLRVTRAAAEIADAALEEIERRWGKGL